MKRGSELKRTPMSARKAPMARVTFSADKSAHAVFPPLPRQAKRLRDTGPSGKVRRQVWERDRGSCVCCGRVITPGMRWSVQHRQRRSQGGNNALTNLLVVCGDGTTGCHARIDSRIDPRDEAMGYTVRSWDDPAMVPVMVHGRDGGFTAWPTADGRWVTEGPAGAVVA